MGYSTVVSQHSACVMFGFSLCLPEMTRERPVLVGWPESHQPESHFYISIARTGWHWNPNTLHQGELGIAKSYTLAPMCPVKTCPTADWREAFAPAQFSVSPRVAWTYFPR